MSILSLPEKPREFGFFVDGDVVFAGARGHFERRSPAHDHLVTLTPKCTVADLDDAVAAARRAVVDRRWSGIGAAERAAVLLKAAAIIRERLEEIAYWETLESGKPISQARAEVGGCAGLFEYAAGAARMLKGDAFNNLGDGMMGLVTREPIGVVGVITPWNFPFLILSERVPFVLAAGCSMVVKPSEFTSATTLMMGDILRDAGLPAGVYNVVTGEGGDIGQALAEHPDVDMLSFTGSTRVGKLCVRAAAKNFKKLGLELGGKNPQIVFADADLEEAADGVAFGIGFNGGQCCVSGSRLICERSIADDFAGAVAAKLAKAKIGDPLDEETQIGAIATEAQFETINRFVAKGKEEGAAVLLGGEDLDLGRGRFVAPTVFKDVRQEMTIAKAEIFGPVLTVSAFDSVDEAIALANDTEYGLAASLWTKNLDKALAVTRNVQAGRFWVNTTLAGGPELPIGGFKQSGWGRETGMYGVEEYTQIKSTHIQTAPRAMWIA